MTDDLEIPPTKRHPKPEEQKKELTPAARLALTALLAIFVLGNVGILYWRTLPPTPVDTRAKLRSSGAEVPVYAAPVGKETIHLLPPGTPVNLADFRKLSGPRYPAQIDVDEGSVMGLIEASDFEPGELDRVRRELDAAGQ